MILTPSSSLPTLKVASSSLASSECSTSSKGVVMSWPARAVMSSAPPLSLIHQLSYHFIGYWELTGARPRTWRHHTRRPCRQPSSPTTVSVIWPIGLRENLRRSPWHSAQTEHTFSVACIINSANPMTFSFFVAAISSTCTVFPPSSK